MLLKELVNLPLNEALKPYDLGFSYGMKNADRLVRHVSWKEGTKEYDEYQKGIADGNETRKSLGKQYKA